MKQMLFIEPFYGGSHKVLIDTLTANYTNATIVTLPAKKWHWRARCGALIFNNLIPTITSEKILFCSSVLNLAELLGLRPDLHSLKKIVYFHENQLIYPVREIKQRDIQYSYNQITTSLAADLILFNSEFNKNSFVNNIKTVIKLLPDNRPKDLKLKIEPKCRVLYFPVDFPEKSLTEKSLDTLHIVWPHRWEFDKGPDDFFQVLFKLKDAKVSFKVSILGESFTDNPEIFSTARDFLKDEIVHFGYIKNKSEFYNILATSHVVVSTAKHEFFGVSMLEAVYWGCYPLAPNDLVYPEIYPEECLFSSLDNLFQRLKFFSVNPSLAVEARSKLDIDFNRYCKNAIISDFDRIIKDL